jgi:hypothetical protein
MIAIGSGNLRLDSTAEGRRAGERERGAQLEVIALGTSIGMKIF